MKLYLIGGKAGSGKDTLANYLKEAYAVQGKRACIMHLASPLYDMARNYFGWDGSLENKPREFLQKMGIEIIRDKLHKPDYLIDHLSTELEILENFFDVAIVADVRLAREICELKKRYSNVTTIHLERPGAHSTLSAKERQHITESDLENYHQYDREILNDSLEQLQEEAREIVKEEFRGGIYE